MTSLFHVYECCLVKKCIHIEEEIGLFLPFSSAALSEGGPPSHLILVPAGSVEVPESDAMGDHLVQVAWLYILTIYSIVHIQLFGCSFCLQHCSNYAKQI